ncbi:unnamed protein product [Effrenium voratum]|nr:unnamed protein product [Effrenium voratum]
MEDRSRAFLAQVCKGQVCEGKRHLSNEKGVRWKTEDADKALKAFFGPRALFQDLSVQRNVVTFNAAIAACASAGEWQQATAVLASMKGHRCIPNIISHSSAVSACEKCGDWVNALRHFDHLASANLTPSVVFCNAAVSACGKARPVKPWMRCATHGCDFSKAVRYGCELY